MPLRPRPDVEDLEACVHGGFNHAELGAMGLSPDDVIDFSVCSNPFPPPSSVKQALNSVALERYPDSEATELRRCLSAKLGLSPENILAGSGSTELIRLIALSYFASGDSVLVLEPTFGEYRVACRIAGAIVLEQQSREEDGFALGVEETVELIKKHHPKGVFVCNPNSPTGRYLARRPLEALLDAAEDGLVILDEAYISFVDRSWSSIDLISRGNVVIVRSMTKDYALAGLRLGYALAHEEIIRILRRVCPPWNVNAMAQRAGAVVLEDKEYLDRCQQEVRRAGQLLRTELGQTGLTLIPSSTNFFLVKVASAKDFRAALLKRGILVRDCTSFGLPQYVRIAARTIPECRRLVDAIRMLQREGEIKIGI